METNRKIKILAAAGALLMAAFSSLVYATGGDSFDEPAPALADSLDFLPGKSLGEIFLETAAQVSDKESPDFEKEILTIAQRLRSEPAAPLVAVADGLLARARQHYSSGGDWCNLLHDVRDVLSASSADKNTAADYIKWRIENKARFGLAPKPKESADETEKPKEAAFRTDLETRVREASGPLQAHWLYL